MYIQRYLPYLPAAGEIVVFDRSWYNRAGVERVMGFCKEEAAKRFLSSVPAVEKAMVESGIVLLKYWLEVSPEEQTKRLLGRIDDGRKTWKLSPMDLASYSRWDEYTCARDEMFAATDTGWAPWYVALSDDKKKLRLNVLSHILSQIPYENKTGEDQTPWSEEIEGLSIASIRSSTFLSTTLKKRRWDDSMPIVFRPGLWHVYSPGVLRL